MKRLTMLAALDAHSGYGQTAIAFARGIEAQAGARVRIRAVSVTERFGSKLPEDIRQRIVRGVQNDPWELLIHHPNFVPTPGKKTAYFSMNESTRLNPMQVHLLNKAEVVIVPSEFCAVTFSASGVTVPIRVVPLGFDPAVYHWRSLPKDNAMVFGAAGSMAGGDGRKGLCDVVTAFQKAFPRQKNLNVKLKLKFHADRQELGWPDDDRIEITSTHLSDAEMADWYASLMCFVSLSKGEGFGLMPLQAMACGRPVISSEFGGVSQFFSDNGGLVLPHTLASAPPPYCGHWAHVKEADIVDAMVQLYSRRENFLHDLDWLGPVKNYVPGIAREFTWEKCSAKLVSVLEEFGAMAEVEQEFHAL